MLKSFEELRHGECKVITKQGKIFKGFFHSEYPCVFFALVKYTNYSRVSLYKGTLEELGERLAYKARNLLKGRLTDSDVEFYKKNYTNILYNAVENGEKIIYLEANSIPFEYGTNTGGCSSTTMQVEILEN